MPPTQGRSPSAVVAYPGVMAPVTEVVRAFAERGLLQRYETTFAYRPEKPLDAAVSRMARSLLGGRAEHELGRRGIASLAGARVRRNPGWDGLRVIAGRLGASEVVADRLWERMILAFDRGVARRLRPGTSLVYGFEHGCRAAFERARELGIARVLDMAAAHYSFSQPILAAQVELFPELRTEYWQAMQLLATKRNARVQAEFDSSSLVVANSTFTARSLTDTGFPPDRVRVVPLGAPEIDPSWRTSAPPAVRTLLFAGAVSMQKGAHCLLEAWRRLGVSAGAELVFAGSWSLPNSLRASLPHGVRLLGRIPRSELYRHYRRASALVFPSFCDGFGMVVTEALAHGLPVITTRNVGAADLVQDGSNGWVLDSGDVDGLAERMQWCLDHPSELHSMREAAEATAKSRPWSRYRSELVTVVRPYLETC